jgi:hypothetical protein
VRRGFLAALVSLCGAVALGCTALAPAAAPVQPTVAPVPPTATTAPTLPPTVQPTPRATSTPEPAAVGGLARGATAEPREPGPPSEASTLATRFESTLNAGDVEGVMALFEPDAEVKVPPDRYVGTSQIRNWVSYLAANHFAIEPGFRTVVGDHASWPAEVRSDYLDHIGLPSLSGTASITIHDGLMQNYTFVLTEDSAHRHRAALLAASEVLQDPIIVGQDAANVYGFNDVFYDANGKLVSYRDVLTADPGSGPFTDLGGQPIVIRTGI